MNSQQKNSYQPRKVLISNKTHIDGSDLKQNKIQTKDQSSQQEIFGEEEKYTHQAQFEIKNNQTIQVKIETKTCAEDSIVRESQISQSTAVSEKKPQQSQQEYIDQLGSIKQGSEIITESEETRILMRQSFPKWESEILKKTEQKTKSR